MQTSFRDVVLQSNKTICSCVVKKGMNLEEALNAICEVYSGIAKNTDLSQVRLKELGINATCDLTYNNLLTEILNALIANDIAFNKSLATLNNTVNNIINSGAIKDEKVKLNVDDPTAGYLLDKISSLQPGSITTVNGKLVFVGFVPVGSVFYVSKSRLPDFDATGKGKNTTDLYGYAISNGANGTTNRLGFLIKCADDTANAGKTGGSNSITLAANNLPSLTMGVTGSISESLVTDISVEVPYLREEMAGGAGRGVYVLGLGQPGNVPSRLKTIPFSFKHSHSFTLAAEKLNANPVPISLIPSHILEIPIERINL
jgi:hypothetical protein